MNKDILKELAAKFPDAKLQKINEKYYAEISRDYHLSFFTMLNELGFDHVSLISGVDYEKTLTVVYHLYSYQNHILFEIKVEVPKDNAVLPSISNLWGGANWHERETAEMFGIVFLNHPDPRHLLLPHDWTVFPLRKSYRSS